jgi:hypothetical protein
MLGGTCDEIRAQVLISHGAVPSDWWLVDPSWLILVFKFSADLGDRFAEVVG